MENKKPGINVLMIDADEFKVDIEDEAVLMGDLII
jgi:hypothetical protein